MNFSFYTNDTFIGSFDGDTATSTRIRRATSFVVIATGILPNLLILLALLTSEVVRARMRNKLVCSFCFLHLINAMLVTPIRTSIYFTRLTLFDEVGCHLQNVFSNIQLMQDFIANWTLVLLILIFLAQICDLKPNERVTRFTSFLGTYAILASPWLASLMLIPVITTTKSRSRGRFLITPLPRSCVTYYLDAFRIIRSLDTAVPLLIAVGLMVVAIVLRRRRFTRGLYSGMQVELLGRGPAIDNHLGYSAAVVVIVICDVPEAVEVCGLLESSIIDT